MFIMESGAAPDAVKKRWQADIPPSTHLRVSVVHHAMRLVHRSSAPHVRKPATGAVYWREIGPTTYHDRAWQRNHAGWNHMACQQRNTEKHG